MKEKTQKFTDHLQLKDISRQVDGLEAAVNRLFNHLNAENEATIEIARDYQLKGATYKRDSIIVECEKYIADTKMPIYLQDDARKRAEAVISLEYVEQLESYLYAVRQIDLTPDNIRYVDGLHRWVVSEAYRQKREAEANKVLADDEQAVFDTLKQVFSLLDEINQTHQANNLIKMYGSEDAEAIAYKIATNRNLLTEEEARKRFPERFPIE